MEAAGQGLGCHQEKEQARALQTELREGKDGMGVPRMTQPTSWASTERTDQVSICLLEPTQDQHWGLLQTRSHWHRAPAWHRLHQLE